MSVFPIRLNLVRIVIDQLSTATTVLDPDFREPIGVAHRPTTLTLEGQVNMKYTHWPLDRTLTGDREGKSRGKLVFKYSTLVDAGVVIRKGDKVVEVGPVGYATEINGVVYEVNPVAPLRGQFLLLEVKFEYDHETRESIR